MTETLEQTLTVYDVWLDSQPEAIHKVICAMCCMLILGGKTIEVYPEEVCRNQTCDEHLLSHCERQNTHADPTQRPKRQQRPACGHCHPVRSLVDIPSVAGRGYAGCRASLVLRRQARRESGDGLPKLG